VVINNVGLGANDLGAVGVNGLLEKMVVLVVLMGIVNFLKDGF